MGFAPARNGLGPRGVESARVAVIHLREIGADAVEVYFFRFGGLDRFDLGLFDEGDRMALEDRVALGDRDLPPHPAGMCADDVLHLHRFHYEELLALAHQFALAHVDRDDRSLHRRGDRDGVFRAGDFVMGPGVGLRRRHGRRRRRRR